MSSKDAIKILCTIQETVYLGKLKFYEAIDAAIKALEQQEVIRCKDCKHHSHDAGYGRDWCNLTSGVFCVKPDDFCSRAERRTDD